jgi:hypothetical protein
MLMDMNMKECNEKLDGINISERWQVPGGTYLVTLGALRPNNATFQPRVLVGHCLSLILDVVLEHLADLLNIYSLKLV